MISGLLFCFSIGMAYLTAAGYFAELDGKLKIIIHPSIESARVFLSTMAGGMISLTVFSFSMVMVMLNQASVNFSPRILPGIISKKLHQIVMGVYLGTIVYLLVMLISINPSNEYQNASIFSLMIGFLLGLISFALFFSFIHSISRSIQIGTLLKGIYQQTRRALRAEIDSGDYIEEPAPFAPEIYTDLNSPRSGYLQQIQREAFVDVLEENDLSAKMIAPMGSYVLKGAPVIRIDSGTIAADSTIAKTLLQGLIFQTTEMTSVNYIYGFKQITEVAVKALSPGINDPGTAINAIDYLTDLFVVRMALPDHKSYRDGQKQHRLGFADLFFEDILYYCFAAIREYGKNDALVMQRLLWAMKSLVDLDPNGMHRPVLLAQAKAIVADADSHTPNPMDRARIQKIIASISGLEDVDFKEMDR